MPTNNRKATTATPSLNKLSPSMRIVKRLLAPNSRNKATTETGSVADKLAPTNKAVAKDKSVNSASAKETPNTEIITPITANRVTGNKLSLRLRQRIFQAASNNNGGKKISKINSGERFTKRISTKAKANPTITRSKV